MIRRPPRSTLDRSSAASDVYKRQLVDGGPGGYAEDYVSSRAAWVIAPDARVNPLLMRAGAQLVSFYPCRFDCPRAVALAESLRAVAVSYTHLRAHETVLDLVCRLLL